MSDTKDESTRGVQPKCSQPGRHCGTLADSGGFSSLPQALSRVRLGAIVDVGGTYQNEPENPGVAGSIPALSTFETRNVHHVAVFFVSLWDKMDHDQSMDRGLVAILLMWDLCRLDLIAVHDECRTASMGELRRRRRISQKASRRRSCIAGHGVNHDQIAIPAVPYGIQRLISHVCRTIAKRLCSRKYPVALPEALFTSAPSIRR